MSAEFSNSNFRGGLEKTAPINNIINLTMSTTEKIKINVKINCKTDCTILFFSFSMFKNFSSQSLY